jgi:hypothetical protein
LITIEQVKRIKLTPEERQERRRNLRKITWVFYRLFYSIFNG